MRNDQTIGFRYLEGDDGKYFTGLELWQQPDIPGQKMIEQLDAARAKTDPAERDAAVQALIDRGELTTRRLFLGKWRNDVSLLALNDIQGRTRIRMQVAPDGTAKLEFLDEEGEVVYAIPR